MIYFLQCGADGPIKVGTAVDVEARVKGLQTGCPSRLRVLAVVEGDRLLECRIHSALKGSGCGGEWFRLTTDLEDILDAASRGERAVSSEVERIAREQARQCDARNDFTRLVQLLLAGSINRLVEMHSVAAVAEAMSLSPDMLMRLRKGEGTTGISHLYFLKEVFPDALVAMDALLDGETVTEVVDRLKDVWSLENARDAIDAQLARLAPVVVSK